MRRILISGACLLISLQAVHSQKQVDLTDLLIECFELLYSPEGADFSEPSAESFYVCITPPNSFYNDFNESMIAFESQRTHDVYSFSFFDSVCAPLKIPLRITSDYGVWREKRFHLGIDFGLSIGDTVYSVFCGEVRIEKFDPSGYGIVVVVRNYNMSETLYGHLDKSLVRKGQKVVVGEPIGIGGNTGASTGPHLHFEIRSSGYAFNPIVDGKFFKKYGVKY